MTGHSLLDLVDAQDDFINGLKEVGKKQDELILLLKERITLLEKKIELLEE